MSNPATVGNVLTNLFSSYEPKSVKMKFVPKVSKDSWLNEPQYANFVAGYEYASTQTRAIPGLSNISPEDAYFIYEAIKRGSELSNHEKFGN